MPLKKIFAVDIGKNLSLEKTCVCFPVPVPPSPGTLAKRRRRKNTNSKVSLSLSSHHWQGALAFQLLCPAHSSEKHELSKQREPTGGPGSKASGAPSGQRRHLRSERQPSRRVHNLPAGFKPAPARGRGLGGAPRPRRAGRGGDPGGSAPSGKDPGSGSVRLSL